MLSRIYDSEGGVEILDVLMKYLYVALFLRVQHMPSARKAPFSYSTLLLLLAYLELPHLPTLLRMP